MIKLMFKEIIDALHGRPRGDVPPVSVAGVSTDSRSLKPGELFFAIRGERFDGHEFALAALHSGALATVVAEERADSLYEQARSAGLSAPRVLGVDDPLAALGRLAAYHRRQVAGQVIAVVGSNGKTTTKAMIDHVLSGQRRGRCSPKSFNNSVGVPLTLLSAEAADEYLVVEIGTNAPGEVAALAAIAQPDMVVLTSLGEEHLEGLRDLDGVAAEECSVFQALRPGGFAAVNTDMPQVRGHIPAGQVTVVRFGLGPDAELRVSDVRYQAPWLHFTLNRKFDYRLKLPGTHNATNAAAAIAVARRFGLEHPQIAARLETFVTPPMRNEVLDLGAVTVINDAYNANPRSALAAIESLEAFETSGRRIAVFGEMRELGAQAAALHRRVGQRLAESRLDQVFLLGPAAEMMRDAFGGARLFGPQLEVCRDVDDCRRRLLELVRPGDVVLLKASRAVELERLVDPLRTHAAGGAPLAT